MPEPTIPLAPPHGIPPAVTPPASLVADPQPYYVRDRQPWAVEQERQRHLQALMTVGEYAMWALMWHIQDWQNGLVVRCRTCNGVDGSKQDRIQGVYKQASVNRCPSCFNTTFEGGIKALIIRPTIFADTDESEVFAARGVVHANAVDVESTTDFRVRTGDYVFRANGDRYQLRVPQRVTLRTGFGMPHQSNASIGYNHAQANIEDPSSFVSQIGPSAAELSYILTQGRYYPHDFARYEVQHAPLIPIGD